MAIGAKAVTAAVEKLLGLSYAHFTQAVFLPQGKFAELLRARPGVRRKLLNELLRLLVYERMREAATRERDANAARKEELERRLREDFAGVSVHALDELARQLAAQQQILADADRRLPELRLKWEEARCNYEWTTELDAKQLEWARQKGRQPEIDRAHGELETANRAAAVVPLLEHTEAARTALGERQARFTEAAAARDRCKAEHDKAASALEEATSATAQLPELRSHLEQLTLAVAKLPLYHKFLQEIKLHQDQHDALLVQRSQCAQKLLQLKQAVAAAERTLSDTEADLALIGFDEERHRRLETVREDAFRLRSERDRLIAALRQAEQDEARVEHAQNLTNQIAKEEEAAKKVRQQAQRRSDDAEHRLHAAEEVHKAVHLRASLQPGQPCPVCLHKVGKLPADQSVPELEECQREFDQARTQLMNADTTLAEVCAQLMSAHAAATATSQQAQASRAEVTQRQRTVEVQERSLLEKVGDLLQGRPAFVPAHRAALPAFLAWQGETPDETPPYRRKAASTASSGGRKNKAAPPEKQQHATSAVIDQELPKIEEGVFSALQHSALQADEHRRTAERVAGLRNELILQGKEMETLQTDSSRIDQELETTAQKLEQYEESLAQTQAEIQRAAGTGDPVSESNRVRKEIEPLAALACRGRANGG